MMRPAKAGTTVEAAAVVTASAPIRKAATRQAVVVEWTDGMLRLRATL